MDALRKLLFPFAFLYGLVTGIRNFLFDKGILKFSTFDLPVIAVGNLSVGGTGKSPQIEYLIRLLSPHYKTAVLSRGYKRKSKGFILADENATAEILGDEPYQFHRKFPDVSVAVDADRTNGIKQLLSLVKPDAILLDDAFQHRKVKAGFYILLTAYNDLYAEDFILPMGNLRESRRGAKRADIIVVTKCPKQLSEAEMSEICEKLEPAKHQQVYFTYVDYDDCIYNESGQIPVSGLDGPKVLLAGIARPRPFFAHLRHEKDLILEFADHHAFTDAEISTIAEKAKGRKIVTTEKDYARLKDRNIENLYYLPIRTAFISGGGNFDAVITDYVRSGGESPK